MDAKSGTYALILECQCAATIKVGRWGDLTLTPGYYIYVGSAFGPGGVRARVRRHGRESKRLHWHIDYLRAHTTPISAWYAYGNREAEHTWASLLSELDDFDAIPGFGCSDCRCRSHLFSTLERPSLFRFQKIVAGDVKALR